MDGRILFAPGERERELHSIGNATDLSANSWATGWQPLTPWKGSSWRKRGNVRQLMKAATKEGGRNKKCNDETKEEQKKDTTGGRHASPIILTCSSPFIS